MSAEAIAHMQKPTNEHYKAVCNDYHKSWFYGQNTPFEKWYIDHILKKFGDGPDCVKPQKTAKCCDVGAGTGRFATLLRERLELEQSVLCVDLSQSMLDEAKLQDGLETLCLGATEFARQAPEETFDRILCKETIMLVPWSEHLEMYQGLHRSMKSGGVCLTVCRPRERVEYPFGERARKVWVEKSRDLELLAKDMTTAGFDVDVKYENFPVTMKQADWLSFVENRIWTTFAESNFSDEHLNAEIEEIKQVHARIALHLCHAMSDADAADGPTRNIPSILMGTSRSQRSWYSSAL
eukprot:2005782-Rhodomonas_salina.1